MVKVSEAIVVEGRYDKNTLAQIIDAPIFQTNGFGIMKDKELLELLRSVAEKRGLVVFTDSDGAGFVIRNFIKSTIPSKYLKHAYIPDVPGKEKRKSAPGKEGILGVEGMTPQVILDCLINAGATIDGECRNSQPHDITKQDFVQWGLSGGADSSQKRALLQKKLNLPKHMSSNALLQALNVLYTKDQIYHVIKKIGELE